MKEQELPIENAIYRHFKGKLYRVKSISYDATTGEPLVAYHRCDENGIFVSIRKIVQVPIFITNPYTDTVFDSLESKQITVNQPFSRMVSDFMSEVSEGIKRFEFVKQLR